MEFTEITIKRNGEYISVKLPKDATVGDIIDASLSLIAKSGFDKITMELYLLSKAYDVDAVLVK